MLSSEESIFHSFFTQLTTARLEKTLLFQSIFPLFPENLVLSKELWNAHSEMGRMGLTHLANLKDDDHFRMSHTFGMALRNAAKMKIWITQNTVK